ncbi:hypothetical protein [Micromonospora sagamiensis]|uniref:LigA protein n=1 Tax=Micromonospora sagamiensis TaxID=47875 RepID=A0A562WNT0_9ACTN|nr:hypothetical protein [Micromonospora sagamiensis]TWJ31908.1 hypothetical protein JD81_05474 [Micromonospora sagamiensis]BCL15037.1 hypothetical protein GCM10017556_27760 [Micromonospora sagamiensis]
MSYREAIDEAIGDSPVSTIDVDRIIVRQRRAGKLRIWGASGAGAAAVLAVTLAVALVPGSTTSTVRPATSTTAGSAAELQRLEDAVDTALKRVAPDITFLPKRQPGNQSPNPTSHFSTQREIEVDGVRGTLTVEVARWVLSRLTCGSPPLGSHECRRTTAPDGAMIVASEDARSTGNQSRPSRSVSVLRNDGVMVAAYLTGDDAQRRLPLTAEQLTAVANDPALKSDLLPRGSESTPPSNPSPDTAQQERIDRAVLATLRAQVPGVGALSADGRAADLESQWTGDTAENTVDQYRGQAQITVGGVPGLLAVRIARVVSFPGCGKPSTSQRCVESKGPGGERVRVISEPTRQAPDISAERHVSVLREDGILVEVSHTSSRPDRTFALTEQQQKAIALDPALTLTTR